MSSVPPKKLPPHILRELRRHVPPPPSSATSQAAATSKANNSSMKWVLSGCIAFTGMAFTLPYFSTKAITNLHQKDGSLTAAQVRRGAFLNSGTKDAGPDPNWDFQRGQYRKDQVYREFFASDDATNLNHNGPGGKYFYRGTGPGQDKKW